MYAFITNNDLLRYIKQEFFTNITAGLSQVELDREEAAALTLVFNKLRHRYNIDAISAESPRNPQVINWVCTIMLYNLHRRQNNRGIPDNVAADYDNVIIWLNDIRDGKEHPDLPALPLNEDGSADPGSNDLRYGSKGSSVNGNYFFG